MNQYRKRYFFDREGNNSDIPHIIWKINTIYVSDLILTYVMQFFFNIELIVYFQVVFHQISSIGSGYQVKHAGSKLVEEEDIVDLLRSYHPAPVVVLY